ncbi:MAG: hypothetical protein Q8Q09_03110 [Deltaproteobacteria bacterium]|nr:hypothetical protein [Deltaproteobacteria bacterium]
MSHSQDRASQDEITFPAIGELSRVPASRILSTVERMRISGELRLSVGGRTHVVELQGGQAAPTDEAQRAIELFIDSSAGSYELRELLPTLAKGVRQDSRTVGGSLADCSAADLLAFCEKHGLTGKLQLHSNERACIARYHRGELLSLTVDGSDNGALDEVFGWQTGRYQIHQRSSFDDDEPRTTITQIDQPLSTIEIALSEILARSQKKKNSTHPPSIAPAGVSPDASVRVIFRAPKLDATSSTQHSATNLGTEVVSLDGTTQLPAMSSATAAIASQKSSAPAEVSQATAPIPLRPKPHSELSRSIILALSVLVLVLLAIIAVMGVSR